MSWLIENFIASNKPDASALEEVEVKTVQFETPISSAPDESRI